MKREFKTNLSVRPAVASFFFFLLYCRRYRPLVGQTERANWIRVSFKSSSWCSFHFRSGKNGRTFKKEGPTRVHKYTRTGRHAVDTDTRARLHTPRALKYTQVVISRNKIEIVEFLYVRAILDLDIVRCRPQILFTFPPLSFFHPNFNWILFFLFFSMARVSFPQGTWCGPHGSAHITRWNNAIM